MIRNMKNLLLYTVFALLLSSCGIYNKYKPVEKVDANLYGEQYANEDTVSFAQVNWRDLFKDPILQKHIDSALVRNADMQSAYLKSEQAKAALMTARLSYLPSFAFAPQGTIGTVEFSNTAYTYNLPLSATWELDIFGKIRNKKMSAKAAYMQSKEYIQAVRTQLIATTANLYYTLLMLDAQYEIICQTEKVWKESVDATRALKDAGYVNQAALAQTEANYYSIIAGKLDLEEQLNKTENAFSLLLFNTPSKIERGKLSEQDFTQEFSVGIPLLLLSNRPDVKMAELSLAQAFYATNSARAAFYPSVSLQGILGWTNSANGVALDPLTMIGSAIGSLTMPLFNRGANIAQLKIAKAKQEEAKIAFTQTLLSAGKEVNEALTKYQTAHNKAELYKKQIESLTSAAESTSLLMKYGSTNYLEVLVAQQTLLQAQLNQVANRLTEIQGLVTLYSALGGGRE